MRRLLLFFMLFPVVVCAQEDYKPLLKDGKTWNHKFTNIYYERSKSLTVQGDTLIDGIMWKKVYNGDQYEKALREDGQKVYELAKGMSSGSQQLLFNFGLQVGERQYYYTSFENDERYLEVTGIDLISSEGIEYRRLKLNQVIRINGETAYSTDCWWIEGIGSDCGIEKPCQWEDLTGYTCLLQSCYDSGKCIFLIKDLYIDTKVTIPTSDKQTDSGTFDLHGHCLPNGQALPSRHGVFIRDGKKILR